MEQLFSQLFSNDETERYKSDKIICESMEDPKFAISLVNFLQSASSRDAKLLESISICILSVMRKYWLSTFFSEEEKSFISDSIFSTLFSTKIEVVPILTEALSLISLAQPLTLQAYCEESIARLKSSTSIREATVCLGVILIWSEFNNYKPAFKSQKVEQLACDFVRSSEFFMQEAVSRLPDSADFLSLLSSILKYFSLRLSEFFPLSLHTFSILSTVLATSDRSPIILKLQSAVIDLISSLFIIFAEPSSQNLSAHIYREDFIQTCIPTIEKSMFEAMLIIDESPIPTQLFSLLLLSMKRGFISSIPASFFETSIVPASLLTEDDIRLFHDIPDQYIAFSYDGNTSIRNSLFNLVRNIGDAILQPILSLPFDDERSVESKIFLLACVFSVFPTSEEIFSYIQSFMDFRGPILCSIIFALCQTNIHADFLNQFAVSVLLECEDVASKLLAINLFQRSFRENEKMPVDELAQSLLLLSSATCDERPGQMLDLLIRHYENEFVSMSDRAIISLLSMWNSAESIESESSSDLLICASNLIKSQAFDSTILNEISEKVVSFAISAFENYPQTKCEVQLICLVSSLSSRLSNPPSLPFVELIVKLSLDNDHYYLRSHVCELLCELIQKNGFKDVAYEFCRSLISSEVEQDIVVGLMMLSRIAQLKARDLNELYEISLNGFLQKGEQRIESASLCLLCSVVYCSDGALRPEDYLIDEVGKRMKAIIFNEARILKLYLICFCILSEKGSIASFGIAESLIDAYCMACRYDAIVDTEDEELLSQFMAESGYAIPNELAMIELPSDKELARPFINRACKATARVIGLPKYID